MKRWMTLIALAPALAGCATAYWDRPGVTTTDLARDSEDCYQAALNPDYPAALPRPSMGPPLPQTQPPPALWNRAPAEAGFTHYDQQSRYEQCMTARGYRPTRSPKTS